jgi:polyribonucleotide nucleotidyltransferase
VVTITDFGAFVQVLPGRDGLLHISDLEWSRTNNVEDVVKMGDEVKVKVTEVEPNGKIKLSRKALLDRPEGARDDDGGSRGRSSGNRRSSGGRNDRRGGSRSDRGRSSNGGESSGGGGSNGPYYRDKK